MLGKTNGNDVADGQLALVEHQLGLLRRCIAAPLRFSSAFDVSLCFGGAWAGQDDRPKSLPDLKVAS